MPYIREGKCVYKKNPDGSKGESRGCSDTEEKAKAHMRALYAAENKSVAQFSMAIVNASISNKADRTMRIRMVNSDTGEDVYEERMSAELFHDFVERIENNTPIPEPFNVICEEDGWCGGMPYPSISHYKSGAGKNVPGEIEKVYVDGEKLKSTAILHDSSLGLAVWKSICKDMEDAEKPLEERSYENPVRISIGFLDLEHKHIVSDELDEEFVFTRTSVKQKCPKCEEGINGKVYLKGQLVHLAFTRVPANPRTSVEVFKMGDEITTKKGDAESIIGDLAEELVGKSTIEDDVLVIKAEVDYRQKANDVEKAFSKKFAPPPRPSLYVSKVTDKHVVVVEYNPTSNYYEENSVYEVGYSEKDGKFSFDERSKWVEMVYGLLPKKSEATDDGWQIEFEKPKNLEDDMEENNQVTKPVPEENVAEPEPVEEKKSTVEAVTKSMLDKLAELKEKGITGDAAIQAIQPVFNEVGKAVKQEFSSPLDGIAETMRSIFREEMATLKPELVAEVLKALPANQPVQKGEVPKPRSLLLQRSGVQTQEKSLMEKLLS